MNARISKASRMARRKKPKKAEGGELMRPPEEPTEQVRRALVPNITSLLRGEKQPLPEFPDQPGKMKSVDNDDRYIGAGLEAAQLASVLGGGAGGLAAGLPAAAGRTAVARAAPAAAGSGSNVPLYGLATSQMFLPEDAVAQTKLSRQQRQEMEMERQRQELQNKNMIELERQRAVTGADQSRIQQETASRIALEQKEKEAGIARENERMMAERPFRQRYPNLATALNATGITLSALLPYGTRAWQVGAGNKFVQSWEQTALKAEQALAAGNRKEASLYVNQLDGFSKQAAAMDAAGGKNKAMYGASAFLPLEMSMVPEQIDLASGSQPAKDKALQSFTDPIRIPAALAQGATFSAIGAKAPLPFRPLARPEGRTAGLIKTHEERAPKKRGQAKQEFAEGGDVDASPIIPPRKSPADMAPVRQGLGIVGQELAKPFIDAYNVVRNPSAMSDREQEEFGFNQLTNLLPIGKGIMVGGLGARLLNKGGQHPVVGKNQARLPAATPQSVEHTGVDAYRHALAGRMPGPNAPLGDIEAQGILNYRRAIGEPSDEGVWGKSAWHLGAEGEPQKELPDIGARLAPLGPIESRGVKDYRAGLKGSGYGDPVPPGGELFTMQHPAGDVHAAYDIPPMVIDRGMRAGEGVTDTASKQITLGGNPHSPRAVQRAVSPALHEVSHPIQKAEGFAVGSAPAIEPLFPEYWLQRRHATMPSARERVVAAGDVAARQEMGVLGPTDPAMNTYARQVGEVLPRNVQARRAKSYRYLQHPSETEDIPRDRQIVRRQEDKTEAIKSVFGKGTGYAEGGTISGTAVAPATPWYVRNEARNMNTAGGLNSSVAGRTDHLPIKVASGSYVLPADVVSGLGQGNTSNGMKVLGSMFSGGPFGVKAPKMKAGRSLPKPPKPMKFAEGGGIAGLMDDPAMDQMAPDDPSADQGGGVDIMAAGGEYVIEPEIVAALGNGDMDLGHEILDQFVMSTRAEHVKTLKKLPGPVKD